MNKVILIGRLTADVDLRQTQNNISTCRFTVAVNRKYKNEQTGEYDADFVSCVAWRQTAEFISKYFSKGKMIAIEGTLRTGSYQDKNHTDVTHYTTDVYVDNVEFCGDKSSGQAANSQQQKPTATAAQTVVNQAAAAGVETESFDLSDFEEILSDGDVPF